jgi:hypothetical protein
MSSRKNRQRGRAYSAHKAKDPLGQNQNFNWKVHQNKNESDVASQKNVADNPSHCNNNLWIAFCFENYVELKGTSGRLVSGILVDHFF